MKLICKTEYYDKLIALLEPYEDIDIVLIEQGCHYEGIGYQFVYERFEDVLDYLKQLKERQTILGYLDKNMYVVKISDIEYIEGLSKGCYLHTKDQEYLCKYKLYELEELLIGTAFIRISKSIIVNITYINYVLPEFNSRYLVIMKSGIKLILSRKYLKDFKKKIELR